MRSLDCSRLRRSRLVRNTLRKLLAPPRPKSRDGALGRVRKPPTRRHNKTLMQPAVPSAGKPASVTSRLLHS